MRTYSIRQYAEYILADSYVADNEYTKDLVKAMLHYGAAAQSYFNYNLDNLANTGLDAMDAVAIPEAQEGSVASGSVNGISYYGASLLFQSKIGVRFYFQVTGDIANYTFKDGAKATYKAGLYYVDVMNINPNQYDDAVEMTVTDGTDTLTVSYSPLRYISRKYNGSDAKLSALVAAMYSYHKAAELYLGENDDEPEITYRGTAFTAGENSQLQIDTTEEIAILSFDYKITSDGYFQIAMLPDWSSYFGYFKLDADGEVGDYAGVTTEKLEDGYIRVTIDLNDVTAMAGTPSKIIDFMYIRGDWSDAAGTITNIRGITLVD